jgi:hypothetical protein
MKLKSVPSRGLFVPIQTVKTQTTFTGKENYNSNEFIEGSPFGGYNGEKPNFPKVPKRLR